MRAIVTVFASIALVAPLAAQQRTGPVIMGGGAYAPVTPTFDVPKDLAYRVAFDISVGAPRADTANAAFTIPARLVNQAAVAGVPRGNVQVAVVVHGTAGEELLDHAEYRKRKGSDNPNAALLAEMSRAGVQVILCGQTEASRKIPRDQLLPFVKVAPSAAMAHAILQRQGYSLNPF